MQVTVKIVSCATLKSVNRLTAKFLLSNLIVDPSLRVHRVIKVKLSDGNDAWWPVVEAGRSDLNKRKQ